MKQKILFIIPWLPYPLISGGHQAIYNGIYAIKDDFDIYIAFEVFDDDKYLEAQNVFLDLIPNAHLLPLLKKMQKSSSNYPLWYRTASILKSKILHLIQNGKRSQRNEQGNENSMCSGWIDSVSPLSRLWLEHISQICKNYHFDIIQVEMPWLISQILTLPNDTKNIYVHHELGFVRRGLEHTQYSGSEYVKACKGFADLIEIGLLNMYDAVVTLSSVDKQKLIEHGVNIPVFDSFAIVNASKEIVREKIDGLHLSFIGSGSHVPNIAGITWFLENCWTSLRNKDNNYKLSIIGEWNDELVAKYSSNYPNVEFLGYVDNLAKHIKGTIMIVPITIGSGIRMKILEACSLGVPFISTSIGAEGIPVVDGENCFIADSPEQFEDKLFKLRDINIQEKFVKNAHEMVIKNYSKVALRENRLGIYRNV